MTSSGTYGYSLSNAEAVLGAFERAGVRAPEIHQEHMLTARREINDLFVELSNRQTNLWSVVQLSIPLVQGTATYNIPSNVVLILDAYRTLNNGTAQQIDSYVTAVSRTIYASIAEKFAQGPPTQYWFDRLINPTVTMWPVPDSGGPYTYNYYAVTQIQDANLPGGETPNLPYRWLGVLLTGLALRLARVYNPQLLADRKTDYTEAWGYAAGTDTESVPTTFTPTLSTYYYNR